jgi:uncharacterized protein YdeI (YjbR/CyaY-like superfamily)
MHSNKTVEEFLAKQSQWKNELIKLRQLLLETELGETIKWGIPVYTINNKNVVGIGSFKAYFGMWFFQGSFLSDPDQELVNAQDGKTKGMRQLRFTSLNDIDENLIRRYVAEAIQNQKEGKEIKVDRSKPLVIPDELKQSLAIDDELKGSFEQLKRGKQREYADYIIEAKREETKKKRIEKIIPMIRQGIGLNDKYQ